MSYVEYLSPSKSNGSDNIKCQIKNMYKIVLMYKN